MLPRVLLLDNHDSFTWNLAQLLDESGLCRFDVFRNDEVTLEHARQYEKLLFSPGPGIPSEIGIMREMIELFAHEKSILGICLGHQAIAEVFGANLINMDKVVHGIRKDIIIHPPADNLFKGFQGCFSAGLYNSWAVSNDHLPSCLRVTASSEGIIMGLAHTTFDVKGLQFHPESYMTETGRDMIANWLSA